MVQDKITGARKDLTMTAVKNATMALGYYLSAAISTLLICPIAAGAYGYVPKKRIDCWDSKKQMNTFTIGTANCCIALNRKKRLYGNQPFGGIHMKKILPLLLILIFVFSGCTSQEADNSTYSSDSVDDFSSEESISILEPSNEDNTIDSSTDTSSFDHASDSADSTSSTGTTSRSTTSNQNNNNHTATGKPSSSNTTSSSQTTTISNTSQSSSQTGTTVTKNQIHLYSYENGKGLVIQATFDYHEGNSWSAFLENNTGIRIDTAYDPNFNTIEYLQYNGKAIVLNNTPVKKGDIISKNNIYKLETLAGPAKIQTTTMYDLINVEHATDNRSYRSWFVRKYVVNETSKTAGNIVMSWIEVREYSKPNEAFNGTIVVGNQPNVTLSYTSEYGLYAGKTIELSDGSKILLGTDMYWFYLGNTNNKRVLCDDYRAYKSVPNDPTDSYWNSYWSKLN